MGNTKNITVLVRSNQKGELYEEYKSTGVQLKFLPLGYISPPKIWLHYQFYKDQNFDVICDFNANFAGLTMLIAKLANIKKRISFYRQGANHFIPSLHKNILNWTYNKLVYRYSTAVLANSRAAINFFFPYRKREDNQFKVIYNGVDSSQFITDESKENIRSELGIPQDFFAVGHLGRYDKSKNHSTILKVAEKLIDIDKSYFFLFSGRDTEKLNIKIQELGLSKHTMVLGYRKDVSRIFKALDCFYFPSITEGQPNALIEAMLSGLPIACSNIKPILECIPPKTEYLTFNPLDINKPVDIIEKIKSGNLNSNFKDYAKKKFGAKRQFEKFYQVLNE
jgi:glycosyltransferase involved in cell wall biosynthesis